jgi:ABC-type lipoprotein release transport system permease subunit
MPENLIQRFVNQKEISYAHVTATLNQKMKWQNHDMILTGLSGEIEPSGKPKSPMIFQIRPGQAYIGYELASRLNIERDDTISIRDKTLQIAKVLSESGSIDDIRIYAALSDVQEITRLPGQINEIRALNCLCLMSYDEDPLPVLREQLDKILPEARVIMNRTIAQARERQRIMMDKYVAFSLPLILVAIVAWIGALAMINVKDRSREIGILRALGHTTGKIASLFLGRAAFIGLIGAVLGFIIGTWLSLTYGPEIFKITAKAIKPVYSLFLWAVLASVLFSCMAAFIPTIYAITQDPAVTLREE